MCQLAEYTAHTNPLDRTSEDGGADASLASVGFADIDAARRRLQRIASTPGADAALPALLPHLLATISEAADPDQVLVSLERFACGARRSEDTIPYLAKNPRAVDIVTTLFSGSQFLTEILLRNPEYLELLVAHKSLSQPKSLEQFCLEARACAKLQDQVPRPRPAAAEGRTALLDALRRFQRFEQLRIGTCDLLDLFDLTTATEQLSRLADSLVQVCLDSASAWTNTVKGGFVVLAMGKLGGSELNYSSDIDLLFLAASDPTKYRRLGERLIEALTRITADGFLYRVDMRLRPWGRSGPLVSSLEAYLSYLRKEAHSWEKQALLKARAIGGDESLGHTFLERIEPLLFATDSAAIRADVHAMKQRTESHLRERGRKWGEVKLGEGSIRDVEFVVQYLQLAHGATTPGIRSRNTIDALSRLGDAGLLNADEHRVLRDGYVFLRTIEHHLQMMHYRQTHTLPDDSEAQRQLARRLGFRGQGAGAAFLARYEQHRAAIRAVYLAYLGGRDMETQTDSQESAATPAVDRHLARLGPSYTSVFDRRQIQHHSTLAEQLDSENLAEISAVPLDGGAWQVTIVGYDYPGELSLICGLLFAHGLSIHDGHVFTYEPELKGQSHAPRTGSRRKIVDVFTVHPVSGEVSPDTWVQYRRELTDLLRLMQQGLRREARGSLAKRVAAALPAIAGASSTLYPIEIDLDNSLSDRYTVLRIGTQDTIGFLYELTNALATAGVYIAQVTVESVGNRVHDTLYVTDANGSKITLLERQRELRAATVLIKHFTHLLPHSPNPESALRHFGEFLDQLFRRTDWLSDLASLERPEVLDALAQLLGVSDFLWNDFLRMQHANLFPVVQDVDALDSAKTRQQLEDKLENELRAVHDGPQRPAHDAPWRATLNAFKDREMFRIDMRHILGHTQEFSEFSEELTDLTEVVVNAAYHLCHEDLRTLYGAPCLEDGRTCEMVVCALGKCGGRELGFASDIELLFVYEENGMTTGPHVVTTAEFYERVVQNFVSAIRARREGIFEIDLQLRPYGKSSSMAVSLEAFRRYFALDGPAWAYERQALVKLRPIAGSAALGQRVADLRDEFVYSGEPFDVRSMRAMRERQIRHLVTGGTFNAKYSPGGLVDVEYLVQGLQISCGHDSLALRQTNIRGAMAALAEAGILGPDDYANLRRAHTFLRWLIDGLRMVRGNAKDLTVPPPDSEAFAFLARRLRYGDDLDRLRDELTLHTSSVVALNARLLA